MDVNPNIHQDEKDLFAGEVRGFGDRPGESVLWLRLDSLIRALEEHRESIETVHAHLRSEIRLMQESGLADAESLQRRQAYVNAIQVIDDWLEAIKA